MRRLIFDFIFPRKGRPIQAKSIGILGNAGKQVPQRGLPVFRRQFVSQQIPVCRHLDGLTWRDVITACLFLSHAAKDNSFCFCWHHYFSLYIPQLFGVNSGYG